MLQDASLSKTPIITMANKQDLEVSATRCSSCRCIGHDVVYESSGQGAAHPHDLANTFNSWTTSRGNDCGDGKSVYGVSALTRLLLRLYFEETSCDILCYFSAGLEDCMDAVLRVCRLHKSRLASN